MPQAVPLMYVFGVEDIQTGYPQPLLSGNSPVWWNRHVLSRKYTRLLEALKGSEAGQSPKKKQCRSVWKEKR